MRYAECALPCNDIVRLRISVVTFIKVPSCQLRKEGIVCRYMFIRRRSTFAWYLTTHGFFMFRFIICFACASAHRRERRRWYHNQLN